MYFLLLAITIYDHEREKLLLSKIIHLDLRLLNKCLAKKKYSGYNVTRMMICNVMLNPQWRLMKWMPIVLWGMN